LNLDVMFLFVYMSACLCVLCRNVSEWPWGNNKYWRRVKPSMRVRTSSFLRQMSVSTQSRCLVTCWWRHVRRRSSPDAIGRRVVCRVTWRVTCDGVADGGLSDARPQLWLTSSPAERSFLQPDPRPQS